MTEYIWQRPDWTASFRWSHERLLTTLTTARRRQGEIADLVAKGLLSRRPGGGRSTSYDLGW
jgi:hypothetical protein